MLKDYSIFIARYYPFLFFGFLMMVLCGFGQTFFIGAYGDAIRTHFSLSHAQFGGIYASLTCISAVLLFWSGKFIDHMALRTYVTYVLCGLGVGCVLIGSAPHIALFIIGLLLVRHCGQGLCAHSAMTTVGRSYGAHRGKAAALVLFGLSAAEGGFVSFALLAIAWIGWQQSWLIYGGVVFIIMLPLIRFLTRFEPPPHSADTSTVQQADRRDVLRDKRFYMILPLYTAPPFLFTGTFFHHGALLHERGWAVDSLALAFFLFALAKISTAPFMGKCVDRFSAQTMLPMSGLFLFASLFMLVLPFESIFTFYTYMLVAGVSVGLNGTISGGLWAELYGTAHLGAIRSLISPITVFSTALSPVLFGLLLDLHINFTQIIMGGLIYSLCAIVLVIYVKRT